MNTKNRSERKECGWCNEYLYIDSLTEVKPPQFWPSCVEMRKKNWKQFATITPLHFSLNIHMVPRSMNEWWKYCIPKGVTFKEGTLKSLHDEKYGP